MTLLGRTMPEPQVTPSDCALAVALPLSREELRAQLQLDHPSDFVQGIRERFAGTALDRVCDAYAVEVAAADRVLAAARSLGVTVVQRAGLGDVARLTARFQVVSVLAHTPDGAVTADDIVDPRAFAAMAAAAATPDGALVGLHLRSRGIGTGGGEVVNVAAVVATLNELLRTKEPDGRRRLGALDRARIEDAFPGALRAAAMIELADGTHSLAAVRRAIAPSFGGVLDLSTCTSIVLGEALKRSRDDFLVLVKEHATRPGLRLLVYELRMQELARAGRPVRFTDVVRVIAAALEIAARSRR